MHMIVETLRFAFSAFFWGHQASERIRTHPNASEQSENFPKLPKTFENFRNRFPIFLSTDGQPLMTKASSQDVQPKQGKCTEAEPLYLKALEGCQAELGATHALTLETMHYLAILRQDQKRMTEAELLERKMLEGQQATILSVSMPDQA